MGGVSGTESINCVILLLKVSMLCMALVSAGMQFHILGPLTPNEFSQDSLGQNNHTHNYKIIDNCTSQNTQPLKQETLHSTVQTVPLHAVNSGIGTPSYPKYIAL